MPFTSQRQLAASTHWRVLRTGLLPFVASGLVLAAAGLGGYKALCLALGAIGLVWWIALDCPRPNKDGTDGKSRSERDQDDQLIHSQKMAALGELSSGIAHEINTPLGIIGQEAELLHMLADGSDFPPGEVREELKDRLDQITTQVERCGEITHQLLTFARKTQAVLQEVELGGLVNDMVRLVEHEAKYQNVAIRRDFQDEGVVVRTDPSLVRQVVLNLLQNAVQAVGSDGEVVVATRILGGRAEIAVRDTGPGIAPENLERIFDPFFTTKPPGKGTGLGLSICLKIMERLGGHIRVASEPGQGALFTMLLPVNHQSAGNSENHMTTTMKRNNPRRVTP